MTNPDNMTNESLTIAAATVWEVLGRVSPAQADRLFDVVFSDILDAHHDRWVVKSETWGETHDYATGAPW